ncbi:MAG TPA: sodium:solute symporter [Rhodothermales bacterium]|nr:sodium:solute symporter [Rhodothermales bacterium]
MLTPLDFGVIAAYMVLITIFGIKAGGTQRSATDYFLGGRDLPWWAVCFSVVATETSTLTVIGTPAIAYGGTLTFFQITIGYLIGRIIVSIVFLPRYFQGELTTAYAFLGQRYGDGMRATASVTFLITRLLADGVRLFATAIPLKVIADQAGLNASYFQIIIVIGIVTILYTLIGGIKAVVWMDVVQMFVYVGGAILAMIIMLVHAPEGWWTAAQAAGKTQIFSFSGSLTAILTEPYVFVTAVVGGAVFTMASHGTDQLIVQRLLTCRSLRDSQRALVGSALIVMAQFALFLFLGLLLWSHYNGASVQELGLTRADEVFPRFIIEGLPPGVSGLVLAGIIAAAMSTLSSSLNSLASSTMFDLYERITGRTIEAESALTTSRILTLVWGIVFIFFANLFTDLDNPVIELGLAIASYTYGGLLGVFLLGLINRRSLQMDAIVAFVVTIVFMAWVIFSVWYSPAEGWVVAFDPSAVEKARLGLKSVAWPWYTVIGSGVTLLVGSLLALRHR